MLKIACVIPAWNEEKNIAQVIKNVRPFVDKIIVIDDASKDATSKLAEEAGAYVIRHLINRGQGAALQTGNDYALNLGIDIIVHFDGDNQFLAEEIKDMIAPIIKNEADIVFGSRFLEKKANLPLFKRLIIYPLAQAFTRLILGIKLSDPQNGFRAMTRQTAEKIRIMNREMAHNSEIQTKAFSYKLRVAEVPITVIYHHFGQKLSGGFKIIKDLFIYKLSK
ncbi:glycosyltransferase family 2 protein [Candidatus Falkowbacteria bacterium]|nr:glycosyltransferase family 2 protein [Candidatus Falkowbacteria bacterium]NCT54637.1 glycosyltransferase family 2 protein [Candidatus Falkowbacteria bacterium]